VKEVFAAIRAGDTSGESGIVELGPAAVPAVGSFVQDPSKDVREAAVTVLGLLHSAGAVPHLTRALEDSSFDIRERAAAALYERFDPETLGQHPDLGQALRVDVDRRGAGAVPILLLGYFPGPATEEVLVAASKRGRDTATKLHSWNPTVRADLPALVALARIGAPGAAAALLERIGAATLDELEFLLLAVRSIDSPAPLRRLLATLDDRRRVRDGLPSAGPKPRLADVAVNAFVNRLMLKVSFPAERKTDYSPRQVAEVRRLAEAALGHL
jgi:hypothetical protein